MSYYYCEHKGRTKPGTATVRNRNAISDLSVVVVVSTCITAIDALFETSKSLVNQIQYNVMYYRKYQSS